jgi:putative ABC transport system substrate-binding protein
VGYGPNRVDLRRRTADFVARIFRGTPAGELPIEDPTTFELIINLKTARALGIDLPTTLLAQANEVIE